MSNQKKSISSAFAWKLCERLGVSGIQFVLQIILARMLAPEHYGVLSLMTVFTTLANVFIQRGFSTALIQNKDVSEEDYSSVLWITLGITSVIYLILFIAAPWIGYFYDMPEIVTPFRILALMLFPGGVNSIQRAKISRELDFKKIFYGNVAGFVLAGAVGIAIAYMGGGIWALVAQNLVYAATTCAVMKFLVNWHVQIVCNLNRVRTLFSYGWKLLVSALVDTLYQDLRSLVVGKKYDSGTLGYYNRGKQFPQFVINAVNSTVQSVMLPVMSAKQDEPKKLKMLMRNSITLSAYIIFPMMIGLAGVAEALVELILTSKWLPCVPYMQIYCVTLAFHPVHSCNLQAINAVGRSDIYLKLEIIKKILGITVLAAAVIFFDSPLAIAMTGIVTTLTSCFINAAPNKKLINYSYFDQIKDILPSILASLVMFAAVRAVRLLNAGNLVTLLVQIMTGVAVYLIISVGFRLKPFMILLNMIKGRFQKRN